MKSVPKMILCLAVVACCIGYTVYNYVIGRVDQKFLLIAIALQFFPFCNIFRALIQELRNKD